MAHEIYLHSSAANPGTSAVNTDLTLSGTGLTSHYEKAQHGLHYS